MQPDDRGDPIDNLFTYHAPSPLQCEDYQRIRDKAKEFALLIDSLCPQGPDRTTAIRKLRECVMTANASIATRGGYYR